MSVGFGIEDLFDFFVFGVDCIDFVIIVFDFDFVNIEIEFFGFGFYGVFVYLFVFWYIVFGVFVFCLCDVGGECGEKGGGENEFFYGFGFLDVDWDFVFDC